MKESSAVCNQAVLRLQRVLAGIVACVEGDLHRIRKCPEGGIHSLRRRVKKLRSILMLARKNVPPQTRRQVKHNMAQLKDDFAGWRDADVMKSLAASIGMTERDVASLRLPPTRRVRVSVRHEKSAAELRRLVCGLPLQTLTWKDVVASFQRTCRKERKAWMAACDHPSAEALHAWRKETKTLYYQMLFLHGTSVRLKKRIKFADRLGRWLGRHHDLEVLASRVKKSAVNGGKGWLKEIGQRQRKLLRRIFRAARRLHDKPLARIAKSPTLIKSASRLVTV